MPLKIELKSKILMRLEQSGIDNLKEYAKILKKTARYNDFGVYLSALVRDIVFDRDDVSSWKSKYKVDSDEAINMIKDALNELEVLDDNYEFYSGGISGKRFRKKQEKSQEKARK